MSFLLFCSDFPKLKSRDISDDPSMYVRINDLTVRDLNGCFIGLKSPKTRNVSLII